MFGFLDTYEFGGTWEEEVVQEFGLQPLLRCGLYACCPKWTAAPPNCRSGEEGCMFIVYFWDLFSVIGLFKTRVLPHAVWMSIWNPILYWHMVRCFGFQVLFGEQLKLRDAITGITQSILEDRATSANIFGTQQPVQDYSPDSVRSQQAMLQTTNQMEIRALQQELTTMRIKYTELERNQATMMELMEKLVSKPRRNSPSSWSPWKKPSKGDRIQDSPSKADLESSTSGRSRTNNAQNGAQRWRNSIS